MTAILVRHLVRACRRFDKAAAARLSTPYGTFTAQMFQNVDGAFGSQRCGCGAQLRHSLQAIALPVAVGLASARVHSDGVR